MVGATEAEERSRTVVLPADRNPDLGATPTRVDPLKKPVTTIGAMGVPPITALIRTVVRGRHSLHPLARTPC